MFSKLKQFYQLFKVGQQVGDPLFWKKGQAVVQPIVAGAILLAVTILKGFGIDLPISDDMALTIAGALFFIVNGILTVITSKTIGVRTDEQVVPIVQQPTGVAAEEIPVQANPVSNVGHSGIDDSTRKRAEQYVKQSTLNGLGGNDA